MKTNIYFQTQYQRISFIKRFMQDVFIFFASTPALVVEVFTRKNFGERYFSLTHAIIVFVALFVPFIVNQTVPYADEYLEGFNYFYLVCLLAFLYASIRRRMETPKKLHEIDMNLFSKYDGTFQSYTVLLAQSIFKRTHIPDIQLKIEPGLAVGSGLILFIFPFSRIVGLILIICGLMHLAREYTRYAKGKSFLLDLNDKKICDEDLAEVFIGDTETSRRGFRAFVPKPAGRYEREKLYHEMIVDDEAYEIS